MSKELGRTPVLAGLDGTVYDADMLSRRALIKHTLALLAASGIPTSALATFTPPPLLPVPPPAPPPGFMSMPGVALLSGRYGTGRTSMAIWLATETAKREGVPLLWISTEAEMEQVLRHFERLRLLPPQQVADFSTAEGMLDCSGVLVIDGIGGLLHTDRGPFIDALCAGAHKGGRRVLVTEPTSKMAPNHAPHRFMPETVLSVTINSYGHRVLSCDKNRYGPNWRVPFKLDRRLELGPVMGWVTQPTRDEIAFMQSDKWAWGDLSACKQNDHLDCARIQAAMDNGNYPRGCPAPWLNLGLF